MLAQRLEQTRCSFGEQVDDRAGVGVGGGLADPEPGADRRRTASRAGVAVSAPLWDARGLLRCRPRGADPAEPGPDDRGGPRATPGGAGGPRVVEGHPATVPIGESRDADLLVVGSHGRGAFTGMLLGSVSGHCVHHASCPVLVVRSDQAAHPSHQRPQTGEVPHRGDRDEDARRTERPGGLAGETD
ncbi:universal stress protein [Streptomyces sp. NPDC004520]|uniref:universal stress protein n=1 Tax=Streptomyces sp. NPDC004520 TaxID=3364702 RepID=UPI0036C77B17